MKLRLAMLATMTAATLAMGCASDKTERIAASKTNRTCTQERKVAIIPKPVKMEQTAGNFVLTARTAIFAQNAELAGIGAYLAEKVKAGTGYDLKIETGTADSDDVNVISFAVDSSLKCGKEGYKLGVTKDTIKLTGKTPQGVFLGVQTILQLLPEEITQSAEKNGEKCWCLPCVKIEDEPRYQWRGMHLDVCRHYFSVDFIKKYIDYLAMHKMNTFHWHLTEDQGWRIEIKKYPKLTTVGATRDASPVYGNRNKLDGKQYGPYFYSQEQVKDIVAYAKKRYITVIPEIELPGHSLAALVAYPKLGCTGGPYKVRCKWGVEPDVYCAGKEESFEFLQDVLDEVLELFPSKIIHIGGDECPKSRWHKCPLCQKRMKDEGLKNEHELQSYFIQRIEKYLNKKGRTIIGWDEILEGGLAPNASVMSWRGNKGGIHAANMGHNVVMSPNSHCYFDHYQGSRQTEPEAIGGFLPLEKVYTFDPTPDNLPKDKHKYILGGQANVWTEYIPTAEHCEYMLLPRLTALSETLWSTKESRNWDNFEGRLKQFLKRLDYMGVNYRKLTKSAPLAKYSGKGYTVFTDMSQHAGNAPANVFDGKAGTFFWTNHAPGKGQKLVVALSKAKAAKTVTVVTGKVGGGDILKKGVLEISTDSKSYKKVATFKNGKAAARVNGKIKSVRVKVTGNQNEWLVIRSISIK